ncbi:MAG: hypothetical protein CK522_04625 [Opitutia bacterium]|nr:MAG: hypothetical protein CK522_04625 [Opitutae bacterium]
MSRRGFSLVLSLTIMAMMVMIVIVLAAFLSVESKLAKAAQYRTQSKLHALVSLRLALAHLQQEAGPDRRMTAQANLGADSNQPGWNWQTIRNPLWTGVWRSDRPTQPPAWIVSGRHDRPANSQSINLFGKNDYEADHWVPFQSDYYPTVGPMMITLVGNATAMPAELMNWPTTPGRPDGRINLPKVQLPDANVAGSYCYWVGDEGVKAKLNLTDTRITPPATTTVSADQQSYNNIMALRGTARTGIEILKAFENIPLGGIDSRATKLADLSLLDPAVFTETTPPTIARKAWPSLTMVSRGLNTDSQWGGLKVDLSSAFEKDDAAWKASEFSEGPAPRDSGGNPLSGVTYTFNPNGSANRTAYSDSKVDVKYDGASHNIGTLYTYVYGGRTIRGPTWDALRNYHRLYKEVAWNDSTNPITNSPTLRARTHFPNTVSLKPHYGGTAHYGHMYNRMDSGEDVYTSTTPRPQPTKVGATPYVARELLVWGLQTNGGILRLTLSPITVLHNPYNVAMRLKRENSTDTAAMRLSYRGWSAWWMDFARTGSSGTNTWSWDMLTLAQSTDSSPNWAESFRTYIPEITLQPGEFRVFTLPPGAIPFNRLATTVNSYDFTGCFYTNCLDNAKSPLTLNGSDTLTVSVRSTGPFYIRHLLTCWPGDSIMETNNSGDGTLYNVCSEVTELLSNSMGQDPNGVYRSGVAAPKVITALTALPGPGQPPQVLAVFDYGVRWGGDPLGFPIFVHSNPTAAMTRPEATGIGPGAMPAGYATTSNSFKLVARGANNWAEVFEPGQDPALAFGGSSVSSSGVNAAVYTEIPLGPPVSLAQYTHANMHIRDQDPLFMIGNSFAPLYSPINHVTSYRSEHNWSDMDRVWLANSAIYDRFFLSGAAPDLFRGVEQRTLIKVLDDFVAGTGSLANPRTKLFSFRDAATTRAMVADHRRIAGATCTDGAFNVNSTSIEAWMTILASSKKIAIGKLAADKPSETQNARYPRAARGADVSDYNYKTPFGNKSAWSGLATLDDDQIRLLAKSIVDETRYRLTNNHRNQVNMQPSLDVHAPVVFRGQTVPVPYIGLAQFVNRWLCGAEKFLAYAGCLQNAITRADVDGANLSNRSAAPAPVSSIGAQGSRTTAGMVPWIDPNYVDNIILTDPRSKGTNRAHMHQASPASLMQSDILSVIGSALTTRSDTFTIRAYGDVSERPGSNVSLGSCWVEAVVQRTPEFCDASQPPETEVCSPTDGGLHNPFLKNTNKVLGRRFQIVSVRVLSPKEL